MNDDGYPHQVILLHAEGIACRRMLFDQPYVHEAHRENVLQVLRDECHYINPIILDVTPLKENV